MKIRNAALAMVFAMGLSACATTSRFEWGSYESALYAYAKAPDKRPGYRAALEQAVARGRQSDRVAPGLLAELGYLHLEDGDTVTAVSLFEEEMQRFPESRPFLTSIVARTKAASGQQTPIEGGAGS